MAFGWITSFDVLGIPGIAMEDHTEIRSNKRLTRVGVSVGSAR